MKNGLIHLIKALKLNNQGTFKDTLSVTKEIHLRSDVHITKAYNTLYLKNAINLQLSGQNNDTVGMVFKGDGANENVTLLKIGESTVDVNLDLEETTFKSELLKAMKVSLALIAGKNLDSSFYEESKYVIFGQYERTTKNRKKLIYVEH